MEDNFLIKANILVKSIASIAVIVLGVLLCIWGTNSNLSEIFRLNLLLSGMLISCSGFVIAIFVNKCPKCKTKLFWKAISEHSISEWLTWLLSLKKCPNCGYEGTKRKDPNESFFNFGDKN